MHQFRATRMKFTQQHTTFTEGIDLTEELLHIHAAFMIDIRLGNQSRLEARLLNTDTEIDVFTDHVLIPAYGLEALARDTHIKRTRREFGLIFRSTSDTSGRHDRSHRVVNRFLYVRETGVRRIGSSVAVHFRLFGQFCAHRSDILRRNDHIRVIDDKPVTRSTRDTVVTRLAAPRIGFEVIMQVELLLVRFAYFFARHTRSVFDHQHLEAFVRLFTQTLQQLRYLIRPVVYRDYD